MMQSKRRMAHAPTATMSTLEDVYDHFEQDPHIEPLQMYCNPLMQATPTLAPESPALFIKGEQRAIEFMPKFLDLSPPTRKTFSVELLAQNYFPRFILSESLTHKIKKDLMSQHHSTGQRTLQFPISRQLQAAEGMDTSFAVETLDEVSQYGTPQHLSILYSKLDGQVGTNEDILCDDKRILGYISKHMDTRMVTSGVDMYIKNLKGKNQSCLTEPDENFNPNIMAQGISSTISPSELIYLNLFRASFLGSQTTRGNAVNLEKLLYFPNINYKIYSITHPFKMVATPLTKYLMKKREKNPLHATTTSLVNPIPQVSTSMTMPTRGKDKSKQTIEWGLLSLDQNLRLLPIVPSDPLSRQVPLIGLWTRGIQYNKNQASVMLNQKSAETSFWSLITNYLVSDSYANNRYAFNAACPTFLLVSFYNASASFYEVEVLNNSVAHNSMINQWVYLRNSQEFTCKELSAMDSIDLEFYYGESLLMMPLYEKKTPVLNQHHGNNEHVKEFSLENPEEVQTPQEKEKISIPSPFPPPLPQHPPQPHGNNASFAALTNTNGKLEDSMRTACFYESNQSQLLNFGGRDNASGKMPAFYERLILQQAEQVRMLQQQVLELQSALFVSQQQQARVSQRQSVAGPGCCPDCASRSQFIDFSPHDQCKSAFKGHFTPLTSVQKPRNLRSECITPQTSGRSVAFSSLVNQASNNRPQHGGYSSVQVSQHPSPGGRNPTSSNKHQVSLAIQKDDGFAPEEIAQSQLVREVPKTEEKEVPQPRIEFKKTQSSVVPNKENGVLLSFEDNNVEISISKINDDREEISSKSATKPHVPANANILDSLHGQNLTTKTERKPPKDHHNKDNSSNESFEPPGKNVQVVSRPLTPLGTKDEELSQILKDEGKMAVTQQNSPNEAKRKDEVPLPASSTMTKSCEYDAGQGYQSIQVPKIKYAPKKEVICADSSDDEDDKIKSIMNRYTKLKLM